MQGGRKQEKWMEIQTQLEKEEIDVYALTETHLRDMEEPPVMDDYVWVGCNRAAGERKGGGVGMLIRRGGNWQRENQGCKEHLWVSGTVGGKKTRLGVAYLWTGNDAREQNKEWVDCLRKDIKNLKNLAR